ncbi:hypothetical protein IPZ58_16695 [Streptomyces roseoverticillatus]|nr:hypothetical protein [Streptomyces roseoverticillatus]
MTEGFVITMLGLAERAGAEVRWEPLSSTPATGDAGLQIPGKPHAPGGEHPHDWGDDLRRKAKELARFMAR